MPTQPELATTNLHDVRYLVALHLPDLSKFNPSELCFASEQANVLLSAALQRQQEDVGERGLGGRRDPSPRPSQVSSAAEACD